MHSKTLSWLDTALSSHFGQRITILKCTHLSGGSIHHAAKVETSVGTFFVKHNTVQHHENFLAEADGLACLRATHTFAVPETLLVGATDHEAFLVLHYVEQGAASSAFWDTFGERLALLHRHSAAQFGYKQHNFIGALPQQNTWHRRWSEFFIEERLRPMLKRARQASLLSVHEVKRVERLFPALESFFPDEPPALLHGDLWSGNFLVGSEGLPVLFDPAVYFGHREAEIAFMHLFGGFSERLFEVYHAVFPLVPEWRARLEVFNLYPLLVHLNLFGRSYWSAIERTLRRFAP